MHVERTDKSIPLENCPGGFLEIIQQCIQDGGLWGGSWTHGGEHYSINNSVYPANPLLPSDDGGPTSLDDGSEGEGEDKDEDKGNPCDLSKSQHSTFIDTGSAQYLQDFLHSRDNSALTP